MSVKPIPEGYSNVIPFLICTGADKVIEFCKTVFDARIMDISKDDNGIIMHASIQIRDSAVMLSEGSEKYPAYPTMMYLYMENCDEIYKRGIDAGGRSLREPTNEFYGDRTCGFTDPSGNQWWVATHIEDLSHDEIAARMNKGGK
ncbi:MAG TPA: VOC family protein [Ignavibacteria bacterium]|nr:VOC family protein [Ignavibacteria bacterium]